MKCQKCGAARATVHITVIAGGKSTEAHLCEKCREKSAVVVFESVGPAPRCSRCGLALRDIMENGRLGCADDYTFFEQEVIACVEKYHGATMHVGKAPQAVAAPGAA